MTAVEADYSRETDPDGVSIRRSGTVAIANNGSLSDAYTSYMAKNVAIQLPTITSAAISFQVQAVPGGDFTDLYTEAGAEVNFGATTGARAFHVPELAGWYAFKIRSGLTGAAVNQGAARTIRINCWD